MPPELDEPRNNQDHPDDGEHEPDYRFTLANERTFLAWLRTTLALLAGAIAVAGIVPRLSLPGGRRVVSLILVALALVSVIGAVLRWRAVELAMRRDRALPRLSTSWVLAGGLCVVALLVAGAIVAGVHDQ